VKYLLIILQQNAQKKNSIRAGVLENTLPPVSRTRGVLERGGNLGSWGFRVIRNPFMPSVSELVIQASPRVLSAGHNIRQEGGRNSKMNRNPWRIAGWDFAA
jgi:hypothetical protein